jgi:FtsP/CotA-like multicopper oxidase with cupredoxin domain
MRSMISNAMRRSCLLTILIVTSSVRCGADRLLTIAANDNRSPAGALRNGVLTISLELGEGQWRPESEEGEALTVYAIAERGRLLQNPGPLIRIPQGTEIHVTLHNALPVTAAVHGLHERPGNEKDVLILQPGATQEAHFKAGEPGAYYYWASTTDSTLERRMPIETQLAGAFIVDPSGVATADRVFVIGVWYKEVPFRTGAPQVATINGKSWPYTERFTFKAGETVHWRWLNPSVSDHAMHLHGFFYHVDSTGDAERYRSYSEAERPQIVTRFVDTGQTFDMTWLPERPGRWLFHCHMLIHMSPPEWRMLVEKPEKGAVATAAHEHPYPAETQQAGMGGLVLGITVGSENKSARPPVLRTDRKLRLTLDEHNSGVRPQYDLQLRDLGLPTSSSPERATPQLIGPPIVLTRGQPVEIELVNHSKQPTAVHWHGIELESYYDGVPDWTGTAEQTTPAIQPGESFLVRMTPPRAGTFIYHTHWHDQDQLENGIYGPLIVLPTDQKVDPGSDQTFLFSLGVFEPFGSVLLINGHPQPTPLRLVTGTKYRFRLINISPNNSRMRASLRKAGIPVQWRIIAKDGADLPPSAATLQTAELGITVGETYDFEYEAGTPQELALEVYLPGPKLRATQGLVFAAGRSK